MKSKLIMNIKKLISILLTTALISSIFPSNLLNSTAFAVDKSVSSFEELKNAISNANNGDTILLDKDITIPNNAQFIITKDITITSHGDTKTITLDESTSKQRKDYIPAVFNICKGCTVDFENITVDLCTKKELKFTLIKLNSNSTLNINSGTTIKNFNSSNSLIDINESKLAINGGSINNCRTTGDGTIHSNLSNVVLNSNNSIHNCYATKGGAIHLTSSSIMLNKENAITNCSAISGGAIWSLNSRVVLNSNNSIHNCYATNGGAIYSLGDSKITLDKENAITNCSATNGGAILLCHSKVFLNHTNVIHSCKAERGGAIYLCASKISYASGFFSPDQYYINCQSDIGKIIYRCNCHNNCSKHCNNNCSQHNKPWCDNITPVSLEKYLTVSNKDFEKFTGTGIPGCVVSIYNGNTELGNGKVNEKGEWEITLYNLKEGKYDVSIIQKNAKGTASEPVHANFTIDRTPPTYKIGISVDDGPFTYYDETPKNDIFKYIWKNNLKVKIKDINDNLSGINTIDYSVRRSSYSHPNLPHAISPEKLSQDGFMFINIAEISKSISYKHYIHTSVTDYANNKTYIRSPGCIYYRDSEIVDKKITYANPTKKDKEVSVNFNDNTVAKIVNTTNNYTLKKDEDYEVKTDKIIIKNKYLSKLANKTYNLEISVYPRGETNLSPSIVLPKYAVTLHIATFDGLNNELEYTYGDEPVAISLNGGSGNGKVTYTSTNEDVAKIDAESGEIEFKQVGEFQIKATKEDDKSHEKHTYESDIITVNPRPVTVDGIKIKDKPYDDTNKAEFAENGTPTLKGIVDDDDVTLINGTPTFSETRVGKNIPINFTEFSLEGSDAKNYSIIQPSGITAEIYELPEIDGPRLDKKPYQPYTISYKFKKGSSPINYNATQISINGEDFLSLFNIDPNKIQINQLDESTLILAVKQNGKYQVKISDYEGNSVTSYDITLNVYKSKPGPVKVTSSDISNSKKPTISGTGEKGCKVTIKNKNGEIIGTDIVDDNGNWSITPKSELSEGTHTLSIFQTNGEGPNSDTIETELTIKSSRPTGYIKIGDKLFDKYLNTKTIGLLFTYPIEITLSAKDNCSGIKKIEFLKTKKIYPNIADIPKNAKLQYYSAPFIAEIPDNKLNDDFFIYAKITNNNGVETYIRSDGVLLYTDVEQTADSMTYIKSEPKQ